MYKTLSVCVTALLLVPALARSQSGGQPDVPPPAPPAAAASTDSTDPTATDTPTAPVNEVAESARVSVRELAHWLASGVDSWFGDRPFEDGGRVTDGRFSVGWLKRQSEPVDVNIRFNARFRLPNLEEKTYFFLGRDDPRDVVTDTPGRLSRQDQLLTREDTERSFFAGVGRAFTDTVDFRLGFRGGLKPYIQGRYKTEWELGEAGLAEFRQTLFWSVADRAGSTTAFSYEHLLSRVLIARWISSATITQDSRRFEWSSLLGLNRSFGDQRLLSLEALVNGRQGSGVKATDYGLQVRWEQPVYQQWLIGGVVIGHFWPRPDAQSIRRSSWAAGGSLLMKF